MSERTPAIRTIMLPKDTNAVGTIFGGVILSHIDLAGAVAGVKASPHIEQLVTVAMDKIEFIAPVFVGDVLSLYAEIIKVGRTSVTVQVEVEATRQYPPRRTAQVTTAEVVYVSVSPRTRRPVPIFPEGVRPEQA